jgi:hypothetical protein
MIGLPAGTRIWIAAGVTDLAASGAQLRSADGSVKEFIQN